ncbi:MAG: radical SAM protein [Gemmatimonadaceae bacterium]
MDVLQRVSRHLRITAQAREEHPSPPFLVLFINSICNMKCEHCFYWTSLNKRDDLTRDEIFALSDSLGRIENLNLSGGEPFLRKEFAEICRKFVRTNQVRQIYVPSNGYFTDRCVAAVKDVLQESELICLSSSSFDGMPEFHDNFV